MKFLITVAVLFLVMLTKSTTSFAHRVSSDSKQSQLQHTVNVYRFFRNHPFLLLRGGSHILKSHIRIIYKDLYDKWECIHLHEGAWNDPNPPYYGGLQMDLSFQRTHGREFLRWWGTADKWPVWAQLIAAERGWHARGFHPWPNTARMCGLL